MKLFADRICEIFVLWKPWFVAVRINRNRAVWNGRRASVKPAGSSKAFKWKCISKLEKVYQKWSNYELAIGRAKKEDPIQIATFLTVIGDEALDVFNAFMYDSDEDKVKMAKVIMSIIVSLVRIQFTRVVYSFRVLLASLTVWNQNSRGRVPVKNPWKPTRSQKYKRHCRWHTLCWQGLHLLKCG